MLKKLKNINTIYFIGIGGVSMSGLAAICLHNNKTVYGSDAQSSEATMKLKKLGATVFKGHSELNMQKLDLDLVVYTSAISLDNSELQHCKKNNIPLMSRAQFLGLVMEDYSNCICISGTHGKTTTTSLVTQSLLRYDPTVLVGGNLASLDGNYKIGENKKFFITETCEYKRNFLEFKPFVATILNIEADHLDYFANLEDVIDAFKSFAELIPKEGALIINADDTNCTKMLSYENNIKSKIITFGITNGDIRANNIVFDKHGCASFDVCMHNDLKNYDKFNVKLSIPGMHNVYNSLSSIAIAIFMNLDINIYKNDMSNFNGVDKRFQKKSSYNGMSIIDDYAHHPTEIQATLAVCDKLDVENKYCIFQPHTYTRTKTLFDEFTEVFSSSKLDKLIIIDIYAAREKDNGLVSSKQLAEAIQKNNNKCIYAKSKEEAVDIIKALPTKDSILLTMGAGDVGELYTKF